jgi:hypothetical protein
MVPNSSNIIEWRNIRNNIIHFEHENNDETRLYEFIKTLNSVIPHKDNKQEWSDIRNTCTEIINIWEKSDKYLLFKKLLLRFIGIIPKYDNKGEWENIRKLSNEILNKFYKY